MSSKWIWFLVAIFLWIQEGKTQDKKKYVGFSFGARSTISTFNNSNWQQTGTGFGGQFRILANKRINTEWYADYITSNLYNRAYREDVHIGWSVFYYLNKDGYQKNNKLSPYVLAGHCFDYTNIKINGKNTKNMERWSSAVQAGLGNHFRLTPQFDVSINIQYMVHLGTDVHAYLNKNNGVSTIDLEQHKGTELEGHLLFTISVNYLFVQPW